MLLSLNISKSVGRGFEPRGSRVLREPGESGGRWLAPGPRRPCGAAARNEPSAPKDRREPRREWPSSPAVCPSAARPARSKVAFHSGLVRGTALPESTDRRGVGAASSTEGGRLDSQERTAGIRVRAVGERVGLLFRPATLSVVGHVQPGRGPCKILHQRGGGHDPVSECLKTGEGTVS